MTAENDAARAAPATVARKLYLSALGLAFLWTTGTALLAFAGRSPVPPLGTIYYRDGSGGVAELRPGEPNPTWVHQNPDERLSEAEMNAIVAGQPLPLPAVTPEEIRAYRAGRAQDASAHRDYLLAIGFTPLIALVLIKHWWRWLRRL